MPNPFEIYKLADAIMAKLNELIAAIKELTAALKDRGKDADG